MYQGHNPPESKEEIRRFYKLPAKFILNVGTIEPRKNLMLLAKALKTVSEEIDLHKNRIRNIETYDVNARLNDFQKKLIEKVVAEMVAPTQLD